MKKGKRGKQKKRGASGGGMTYTVCGEWFPGPDDPGALDDARRQKGETPLDTEMRLFCSCLRRAFNRLLEGRTREELKKEGQSLFALNSRFTDDAILKAQEVISSQKELLVSEIKETQAKLARSKKKLAAAEQDLERARKSSDPSKVGKAKRTAHGRSLRVKKLSESLAALEAHRNHGTIPKVVFGSRSLWKKVCKGQATNAEWKAARQNRLYARGDETKGGNPNIRIKYEDGEFTLFVVISHLSEQNGTDKLDRPIMSRAPRVEGKLWLPEKHRLRVWDLLLSGAPYTVEVIRGADGRYRAHITFTVEAPSVMTNPNRGYLGVDTNPDGIALANVGHIGQPEPWPEGFTVPYPKALHKFDGEFQATVQQSGFLYVKIPELAYSHSFRRAYLIGVLAQAVVDIAKDLGKPLAIEKLDFGKDRLDTNKRFNRMASNFPFRKLTEAIIRRAYREGVGVKQVWPAHTSTIGYWKYVQRYGIIVHHAAALVIARRATGFKERITAELRQKIQALKEKLVSKVDSLPGEGTGMTRKTGLLLKRLDGKIIRHNGLSRFQQESFHSVWSDLKRLALSTR
jgi:IS605 OrfB family transposase